MNDDDDLTLRAKRTAAELNWLLDRLAEHDIDCVSVTDRTSDYGSYSSGRRVELLLHFKARRGDA